MTYQIFKTKAEIARQLGISVRTLYRRLNKFNYQLNGELLTPEDQERILKLLVGGNENNQANSSNALSGELQSPVTPPPM